MQYVGIIILLQAAGIIRDVMTVQTAFIFKASINAVTLLWFLFIKGRCDKELEEGRAENPSAVSI